MLLAITREVSDSLAECEVTFIDRSTIDIGRARRQHARYVQALGDAGLTVVTLPALHEQPDAVFVEDPLLVLDEVAIALSPGAPSRRPEIESLVPVVEQFRTVDRIALPATIDGGDILRVGRTLYVGRSRRTNDDGIDALDRITGGFGYDVVPVAMEGCLHLKSGCTYIGDRVLINSDWVDASPFASLDPLEVAASEPWAADVLHLPDIIVMPAGFPATQSLLEASGHSVITVDVSEFQKAEAGVTCLSVVFDAPVHRRTAQ